MSPYRLFGSLLAASLILAACSSPAAVSSPVYDYVGLPDPVIDESFGDDGIEDERKVQAAIAACMEEEGEQYLPIELADAPSEPVDPDGLDRGSREWAEKYGFGISTQRFTPEQVGPDLVGFPQAEPQPEPVDPNSERLESMSAAEADSYLLALFGDLEAEPFEPGCMQTSRVVHSSLGAYIAFSNMFRDDLDLLREEVQADERIVAITEEFESCASDDGNVEPIDRLDLLNVLAELEGALAQQGSFTPADLEFIGELQRAEIESAILAFDCGGSVSLRDDYRTVGAEYEERFIEQHKDRLDEFVASRNE